ncbi:hypothetical protein D9758_002758 [Tetrapyrgos nigripes]|uniref:NADH dehydrogenase [ubiquinone] iron-sulfur protein 4, mitochondrial n=1 Tax=Tetrapyrgos nigripes TaxID=182062 RepID=A0A8H5LU70_9AGAR|nr:hypothetical protein D9758_002758 [Tetrapyrgos nigripes]
MSLLRSCQRATLPCLRAPTTFSRGVASESTSLQSSSKEPSEVAPVQVPEARDVMTADVVSGAPSDLRHRQVRIFQPTRNTMQSGGAKTEKWRIDFDILQGGGRWENPLMGWASSADYMQGTRITFRSKEDAIHFAEKQGWDYYVQPSGAKRIPPKNYAENYLYRSDKLRLMKTK